ncbi:MAG TPA: hypothetical protein VFC85_07400, partial [Verrucomicrobiae bacterium]|nr:hypothetical protein [Verrucomicrobiae bacterium]
LSRKKHFVGRRLRPALISNRFYDAGCANAIANGNWLASLGRNASALMEREDTAFSKQTR